MGRASSAVPLGPAAVTRLRAALAWVVVTSVGLAVAAGAGALFMGALGRPLAGIGAGVPYIAVWGVCIGAILALLQLVALRRSVRGSSWLVATALGTAVCFVLAGLVGELLGNFINPLTPLLIGEGTIEDTSGALLGLSVAFAQWRVMRGTRLGTRWWIAAGAIGAGLGYGSAAAILELLEIDALRTNLIPAFGGIVGIFMGTAQGIVLGVRHADGP